MIAGGLVLVNLACAEEVQLKLLSSGAVTKLGGYVPQRLKLSSEKPAGIKQLPADLSAPWFGALSLGPKESPTAFAVVLDEPEGGPARLFVDANGNGDLRDDPAVEWKTSAYKAKDSQLTQYKGRANVNVPYGKESAEFRIAMYRFDKRDPGRTNLADVILFYADYAREGEIRLGGKSYQAMLVDNHAIGDFRGDEVQLFVDIDSDGKFDRRAEALDVGEPFNVGGTTYEIAGLTAAGDKFRIEKSSKTVAEITPAPKEGMKAPSFKAKTTAGKDVDFPTTYKGKLVLLDFWATWCGPCIAELPHLTAAYEKFHPQGLEVLGISLDQANAERKLADFTQQKNMPWPQIFDGKYWQAEVAKLYKVDSIPRAFLVEGDTGNIVAAGSSLRGKQLEATLEKALAARKSASR